MQKNRKFKKKTPQLPFNYNMRAFWIQIQTQTTSCDESRFGTWCSCKCACAYILNPDPVVDCSDREPH